jgi:cellulose synthase/poly-beta-1,6-N-acetylglucosamine synthase-like glycosyltransferase
MIFFWTLLIFYSVLTIGGVKERLKIKKRCEIKTYPSVAVLIPAHNEEVVIQETLKAMVKLYYPGQLDIFVLDDSSVDSTEEIVRYFSNMFSNIHYIKVPNGYPKGKSRVLNYGLSITFSDYFLVYDADNQPEQNAVIELVHAAEETKNSAGAVGYVRTINSERNLLTKMISIEFQVFQLLMQSGRWNLFKTGSLAGTNMLLKRSVIEELGGYDPYALAEDAELTIRITAMGKTLPVVSTSQTWEQEPEKLSIFIRQRTRWLTGNIYLLEKSFREISYWKGKTFIHTIQHTLTYFLFVILLLFSHVWFVLGLMGLELPNFSSPLLLFWFMSYIVYTSQVLSAMVLDRNISPFNIFVGCIMYFTYAQLFIVLLMKSLFSYVISRVKKKTITWDKTVRFRGEPM